MPITIEMPKLSDTMTEGTLVKWIKKSGDAVKSGDVLAEVETDKATMEMEAFDDGVLGEVFVEEGQKVDVGQKLALLLEPGEEAGKKGGTPEASKAPQESSAKAVEPKAAEEAKPVEQPEPKLETAGTQDGERLKASPLARKVASEAGVDLKSLAGSGPGGRIVRDDVLAARKPQPALTPAKPAPKPILAAAEDKRIPLSGMRKTIANRLLESKTTIPHFYLQVEIDADGIVNLRKQINTSQEALGLPKVTVNDFILKATAVAAARVPQANAAFEGDSILQFADVQLACAVAVEEGLVTPVIRAAQSKSLTEISASIKDLAGRARSKKLKPEEYQGGTITVSNLGGFGVEQFFAIINPPQAVIVSVGAIVKKPVVNPAGEIVVGQRIAIGISCDHRVVDGAIGAQFLSELKRLVETPALMLL
jgi:pyruvate dehydrogenase E2 component (dihydrolipoamide acetyltransferase)